MHLSKIVVIALAVILSACGASGGAEKDSASPSSQSLQSSVVANTSSSSVVIASSIDSQSSESSSNSSASSLVSSSSSILSLSSSSISSASVSSLGSSSSVSSNNFSSASSASSSSHSASSLAGILVSSDAELVAAIDSANENLIIVAPGNYTTTNLVTGLDRSANPLTIRGQFANNKPVFNNATQSLVLTRFVTFKDLRFVNTGALNSGDFWFSDAGGNGNGGDANNIVLDGLEFYSPEPNSLTDTTPNPDYGNGMARLFRFSNYKTYNYTIQNITAQYTHTIGDFRMNGDVLLNNIVVDKWYFDGIRISGHGTEGYVEGNRIIANLDIIDNIAVYDEISDGSPHPDNTQKFNSGTTVNNTNPRVTNTLFYHNRFNPGQLRSNNTQSGLSQTHEENVGYVENIYATKSSPHGISLEGGANGVLIERNSLVAVNNSNVWIRIFKANGQVAVYDNYFRAGFNLGSGNNVNVAGYELTQSGNETSTNHENFFSGSKNQSGIAGLISMFTPISSNVIGALNTSGQWRGLPHRPMMAAAPVVTAGAGSITLVTINTPSLWSPDQAGLGANNCSSFNVRWSPAAAYSWTQVSNVVNGEVISPVTAGEVDVQTQCVNIAGAGLWSRTARVNVN